MKLVHFRGPGGERNFGDELGPWLWDRLLDYAFDDDANELFLGIGTLLNDRLAPASRVVVFGSGVGYGGGLPRATDRWSIYCLRGPLSAEALGVSRSLAITDPAVLVRLFRAADRSKLRYAFSYMPHWRNACDEWRSVCRRIGFGYIDPAAPVEQVLDEIQGTRVLIAEALHGAIVADALRVPWIAARSSDSILEFKWRDWSASLDLDYRAYGVTSVSPLWRNPTSLRRAKYRCRLAMAAAHLRALAFVRPTLSDEQLLSRRIGALTDALARLRADLPARLLVETIS